MQTILALSQISPEDTPMAGGKAVALARLARWGYRLPDTVVLPVEFYRHYVSHTGIQERIMLELNRKAMGEMRWEEIWDASLRIRNLFLSIPLSQESDDLLHDQVADRFAGRPLVVRSSAPMEDSAGASFAGRHESYVNVTGHEAIQLAIRKVWASLWSDAALLYRDELGLNADDSAMAVVIQEMIVGDAAGVAFSRNPTDPETMTVEAVFGLNQGLVDGEIEPDRWIVDRRTLALSAYQPSPRDRMMVPAGQDVKPAPIPTDLADHPPLTPNQLEAVCRMLLDLEERFSHSVDVEWTFRGDALYLLQARPITTGRVADSDDQRQWYLSLHRSFENLQRLRERIEGTLIPEMIRLDRDLEREDPTVLDDTALAEAIAARYSHNETWVKVYWDDFIPFAHGIRLFGQVYNDAVKPENPYEFLDLLANTDMTSLKRNRDLEAIAAQIRAKEALLHLFDHLPYDYDRLPSGPVRHAVDAFIADYGDLSCPVTGARECAQGPEAVLRLAWEMAAHPPVAIARKETGTLEKAFFDTFPEEKKRWAATLLDLARSSYRLRDDDNIYLGRIEAHFIKALNIGIQRLAALGDRDRQSAVITRLHEVVEKFGAMAKGAPSPAPAGTRSSREHEHPRQLVGQPAGAGIAQGPARVIRHHDQLSEMRHGEVLVCDAIDPNMTFVVPLAAAIVERRGGMLIHGAIIAREYGIPCVTGVPGATTRLKTGRRLTVDGFLGIVTVLD